MLSQDLSNSLSSYLMSWECQVLLYTFCTLHTLIKCNLGNRAACYKKMFKNMFFNNICKESNRVKRKGVCGFWGKTSRRVKRTFITRNSQHMLDYLKGCLNWRLMENKSSSGVLMICHGCCQVLPPVLRLALFLSMWWGSVEESQLGEEEQDYRAKAIA